MTLNPSRLSVARRRRGLSKRELGELTSLSDRSLVFYERGERVPSAETVNRLAGALEFPVEFFEKPDIEYVSSDAVSFRALTKMSAAQRDRALAGGDLGVELSSWLDGQFDLPESTLPDLRLQGDPEAAAMALRSRWGLGDKPISTMVGLLEANGVRVFSLAEQVRELDAFSFWHGDQPFIFLNSAKSGERSRFDAAHELGHLVMHHHGQPSGREAEREADAFASSFLMPRSSVITYAPHIPAIERLIEAKVFWKVSVAALAHRLHTVGIVSEWTYRNLAIEIQQKGFRVQEPETIPREMSVMLQEVFAQLREEGKGRPEIAQSLAWPVAELDALTFQLALTVVQGSNRKEPGPKPARDKAAKSGGSDHLRVVG